MAEAVRVRDVVHAVVTEVAPEELPLLDALCTFDDATVVRRLRRRGRRREPLGFGVGELAVLVTPVVWIVLDETIRKVTGQVERRLFRWRRKREPRVLPPFSSDQLAAVHRRVVEIAAARGIDTPQAEVIADGVVTRLVLAGGNGAAGTHGAAGTNRDAGTNGDAGGTGDAAGAGDAAAAGDAAGTGDATG